MLAAGGQLVAIDFAVSRGQRAELGRRAGGQLQGREPLEHALTGPIAFDAFFKAELHHGEAENGARANGVHARDVAHREFDGDGDLLLDLFRRAAWIAGQNLDHLAGDVGVGVDLFVLIRIDAEDDDRHGRGEHNPRMMQRQFDEPLDHNLADHKLSGS